MISVASDCKYLKIWIPLKAPTFRKDRTSYQNSIFKYEFLSFLPLLFCQLKSYYKNVTLIFGSKLHFKIENKVECWNITSKTDGWTCKLTTILLYNLHIHRRWVLSAKPGVRPRHLIIFGGTYNNKVLTNLRRSHSLVYNLNQ